MGVRTLDGMADGSRRAAAMYDSVSGAMIGPIWEAEDALEQIDAFQAWLAEYPFAADGVAEQIGLGDADMPLHGRDGDDPRHWGERALGKLIRYWKLAALDEVGMLKAEMLAR